MSRWFLITTKYERVIYDDKFKNKVQPLIDRLIKEGKDDLMNNYLTNRIKDCVKKDVLCTESDKVNFCLLLHFIVGFDHLNSDYTHPEEGRGNVPLNVNNYLKLGARDDLINALDKIIEKYDETSFFKMLRSVCGLA